MATAAVYLEQYLDNLDSLPEEMREKFEKIRDLDQKVMEEHKRAEGKKLSLFRDLKSGRKMEDQEKKKRITEIQSLYRTCNTISEQKCNLAGQAYEMIDKHIRKLDTELARFEGELKQQQMEQLNPSTGVMGTASAGPGNTPQMKGQSGTASGASSLKRDKDSQGRGQQKGTSHGSNQKSGGGKGGGGGGSETGKRRRKNEAASYNSELLGFNMKGHSSNKDASSGGQGISAVGASLPPTGQSSGAAAILGLPEMIGGAAVDVLDMPVDPNEPTYCICQQVSYGEMIGCDNPDCPIEWFHFNCVGLSAKPKGKWFCYRCSAERKKKLTSNA
ncbi:inhibitor of growth protein 4-like [Convolutriloba macropyga]|uniref:inhibitor of growth protein 4-like n=1 Tax=Convolutriloba macropyga TaxID=536237 RepID=UPI003F51ED73